MKIPLEAIPKIYDISKRVYEGEFGPTAAGRIIMTEHKTLNLNSARDYINNFRYLLDGERFERTMSTYALDYYLDRISKEYQGQGLLNALTALKEHIVYYETRRGINMRSMREIHERYSLPVIRKELTDELEQDEIEALIEGKQSKQEMIAFLNNLKASDAEKVVINHTAYKRDNKTIALIKILRDFKCQLCNESIQKKTGKFYIEAAHITPKSCKGPEMPDNILILCPNHHKEFDYGNTNIISRDSSQVVFSMNETQYTVDLAFK